MATVVVTFFLFARFYVYKMDADWLGSQRDQYLSQREKRWSMNSQRLEEIVAELMKPISNDGRRSFDTDLSALLEEYLTEAGLHALEAAERSPSPADTAPPNFAEIALLLQQSAHIYSRKVDFLYKHVLSVSDSLLSATQELENASASVEPEVGGTPTSARRKRKASVCAQFAEIALEASAGAARECDAPRPPPTLPRPYIELEPRALSRADHALHDYSGDDIGLLTDFQVTWRLHEGLLVDELEGGRVGGASPLRPLSLVELQAALEAGAPPSPPPLREDSPPRSRPSSPLAASTPLPAPLEPAPPPLEPPAVVARRERKRRSAVKVDDIFTGNIKIVFGKDLMRRLREVREFSIDERWISSVVGKRKLHILSERRRLSAELDDRTDHDHSRPPDKGFPGWASVAGGTALEHDSDDDGFFEQSSGGSSVSEHDELAAWRASVLRRAAAAHAHGSCDVHALGARVLRALHDARRTPRAVTSLLREHARRPADVSRLVLATLFLANAGNVEIVGGAPLSVDSYSVRLVSADLRRYQLSAAHDPSLER